MLPHAAVWYAQSVNAPGFDFTRDGQGAALRDRMDLFDRVLLDPFRTGGGDYSLELATPITRDRRKMASLAQLVLWYIMRGRHVTLYGPGIHDIGPGAGADYWRQFAPLGEFEDATESFFAPWDWLAGSPQFAMCFDGVGAFGKWHPATYLAKMARARGHAVMTEGFSWPSSPLYGYPSITMSSGAGHPDAAPIFDALPNPEQHAVWISGEGPDHHPEMVGRWIRAGHPIYLSAHTIVRGAMPSYWVAALVEPGVSRAA